MTPLPARIESAARDLAARINAGVLRCTDPEQTADLRGLTMEMLAWADEMREAEVVNEPTPYTRKDWQLWALLPILVFVWLGGALYQVCVNVRARMVG